MLYNIKATTHMSIPVDTVKALGRHENVVGLKDSERDEERLDTLASYARDTEGFHYQLGWAAKSTYALKAGADGIVPSTANAFPDLYHKLYVAVQEGDDKKAARYQSLTDEISLIYQGGKLLSQALPGLKVMLEHMGICPSHCISPCYPLSQSENETIIGKTDQILERISA
jgi:4-hydroxy-tetrahydrodipicolinate synthase